MSWYKMLLWKSNKSDIILFLILKLCLIGFFLRSLNIHGISWSTRVQAFWLFIFLFLFTFNLWLFFSISSNLSLSFRFNFGPCLLLFLLCFNLCLILADRGISCWANIWNHIAEILKFGKKMHLIIWRKLNIDSILYLVKWCWWRTQLPKLLSFIWCQFGCFLISFFNDSIKSI